MWVKLTPETPQLELPDRALLTLQVNTVKMNRLSSQKQKWEAGGKQGARAWGPRGTDEWTSKGALRFIPVKSKRLNSQRRGLCIVPHHIPSATGLLQALAGLLRAQATPALDTGGFNCLYIEPASNTSPESSWAIHPRQSTFQSRENPPGLPQGSRTQCVWMVNSFLRQNEK